MAQKQKQTEGLAIFTRNDSKTKSSDPRCSLDPESVVTFGDGDNKRPVFELTHKGQTIRYPIPRNLYVPGGDDVAGVKIRLVVEDIERSKTAPKAGEADASGDSDGVNMAVLIAETGDVEATAAQLAADRGVSRPAKMDKIRAKALVAKLA